MEHRLEVKRIKYASPGFIELGALLLVVTQLDKILTKAFNTWDKLDRIYDGIQRRYRRRHLARLSLKQREHKLQEEHVKFIIDSCRELSEAMGFENPQALEQLSDDPLGRLKILMSFWRRLRELLAFMDEEKVRIQPSVIEVGDPKRQLPPKV